MRTLYNSDPAIYSRSRARQARKLLTAEERRAAFIRDAHEAWDANRAEAVAAIVAESIRLIRLADPFADIDALKPRLEAIAMAELEAARSTVVR